MKAQTYFSFCFDKVKHENQFYAIDVTTAFFYYNSASWGLCLDFFPERKRVKNIQKTNNIQRVASSKKKIIVSRDKNNVTHPIKETTNLFHLATR